MDSKTQHLCLTVVHSLKNESENMRQPEGSVLKEWAESTLIKMPTTAETWQISFGKIQMEADNMRKVERETVNEILAPVFQYLPKNETPSFEHNTIFTQWIKKKKWSSFKSRLINEAESMRTAEKNLVKNNLAILDGFVNNEDKQGFLEEIENFSRLSTFMRQPEGGVVREILVEFLDQKI